MPTRSDLNAAWAATRPRDQDRTCRGSDRWLASPIGFAELDDAYLANAVFDADRDDPEFGYRYRADEACAAGFDVADRTMWRICAANGG